MPLNKKKKGSKISILLHEQTKIPVDVLLDKASLDDRYLLEKHVTGTNLTNSVILGDKGYINKYTKQRYNNERQVNLITPYRIN